MTQCLSTLTIDQLNAMTLEELAGLDIQEPLEYPLVPAQIEKPNLSTSEEEAGGYISYWESWAT